jgi:glyoxylase-like metal-dependent hydrolase (beta-lactamase superfamily II)
MKTLYLLLALALATSATGQNQTQQDAATVIEAATKTMGTATLQSIRYTGSGSNNSVGQAFTSGGPWPRFKVTKYVALVNYTVPTMRQEIVRIDNESPPRGGGAGPFNPNTGQGGIRPIPGDIIQNQNFDGRNEIGSLNIWLTPHGFLKGALANGHAGISGTRGTKKLVTFTAFNKYTVTGTINEQNQVEHVETRIDVGFTGDTVIEATYSDYKDFGGVKFPMHVVQQQGGYPVLDIVVTDVEPNSSAALDFRGNPQRGGAGTSPVPGTGTTIQIQTEKIADGLWFLNSGAPQSLLVEFKDYVVIIEAPTGDERSMATIAETKRMFPNKPIKYVVNTHHHSDHAGGIRAYVAEGIPIITHESHRRYYEQEIFKNPHTLNPDRLARMPRAPVIEAVKDTRILTDGNMTLELHLVRGNLHSEGLLMAYVPKQRLLIQADTFTPRPGVPPLPSPSPYTTNIVDNVERLKLNVEQVAHVHGGVDSWKDVLKAAGRQPAN